MEKKIYIIQPTYRKMDGSKVKGWSLFNHSILLPILSAAVPNDWEKEICLEYFDKINYDSDADIVIITCMGYDIMYAKEIAGKFKEMNKKIIFGAHMDEFSDKILIDVCDSVFYGYPTHGDMSTMLNDAINNNLNSEYNFEMNINFPFDYSVLSGKKMPVIQVQSSAGCRNKCNYCCATPQSFSGKYRLRKIEYIINDLKAVSKITRFVSFIDANIYNNSKFLKKLCCRIIDEKIKLIWGAQSTVDIGDNTEVLKLLYEAGCRILFVGLESLEQQSIYFLEKQYNTGDYRRQISKVKEAGIHVAGYFMLGMDYDTSVSAEKIYNFVRDTNINLPVINVLMPVPGTKLYKKLKEENRMCFEDYQDFLKKNPLYSVPCHIPFFVPKNMSPEELTNSYLNLVMRLYTYRKILSRSLVYNPFEALKLLLMNFELRKKYMLMAKLT